MGQAWVSVRLVRRHATATSAPIFLCPEDIKGPSEALNAIVPETGRLVTGAHFVESSRIGLLGVLSGLPASSYLERARPPMP
jgi:hypothetical protein